MNTMHLIGSEDVARAGHNMTAAGDTISRAANEFDAAAMRLGGALEQHGYQMGALAEALAGALSLRDQLAMAALQGYLASASADFEPAEYASRIASDAYLLADAMLKAREA